MVGRMLVIMLNREGLVDEVLSAMIELEIIGAVVLDGTSMEQVLSEDVPIFAGLWQGDGDNRVKTILAPLVDSAMIKPLMQLCKDAGADFADPEIGRMFSWAVEYHRDPDVGDGL